MDLGQLSSVVEVDDVSKFWVEKFHFGDVLIARCRAATFHF